MASINILKIKKSVLNALGVLALVVGVTAGTLLVQQNQDIREKAAPATTAYIFPATQNSQLGSDVTFNVRMDTSNNQVSGVDLRLKFDPNAFQVVSLERGSSVGNLNQTIVSGFDNVAGTIKYIIFTTDKTKAVGGIGMDILRVNAKSKTSASLASYTISFDNQTAASGVNETQNILTTTSPGSITLIASSTNGPTNACGGTCGSIYNCNVNLFCYQGFCRNPDCPSSLTCGCPTASPKPTKSPTPKATIKPTPTSTPTSTPFSYSIFNTTPSPTPRVTLSPIASPVSQETSDGTTSLIVWVALGLIALIVIIIAINSLRKMGPPQITPPTTQTTTETYSPPTPMENQTPTQPQPQNQPPEDLPPTGF